MNIRPGGKPLCKETYVGNVHVWIPIVEIAPDPLPWWKRLLGFETCYCMRCGAEKERRALIDYGL